METFVDQAVERKEAWDKVTGNAKYAADITAPGMLYAQIATATIAHGTIKNINTTAASQVEGVKAVITGDAIGVLYGPLLSDRPLIASDTVRYFGEPVALVVALTEDAALQAVQKIQVEYQPLPVIDSAKAAMAPGAALIHNNLNAYQRLVPDVRPEQNTNVCSSYKVRKGDLKKGWSESDIVVEETFALPATVHAAMETRCSMAQIAADGTVTITTASQAPYTVKKLLSSMFGVEEGKVVVKVPFVGGGFGGKSAVQTELLAYLASQAVGGRPVRLWYDRGEDMNTAPGRLALEGTVKIGFSKDGMIKAAQMTYKLDCGAYSDISPNMSKAIAADCSGPYNIENLACDSLCVYTNHTYATAYRGFSHESYTFCLERVLDEGAAKCGIDPLELRQKNAIKEGNYSPGQVLITKSNAGNTSGCIERLKTLMHWEEGNLIDIGDNKVRAKGVSCLWKTPNPPVNAAGGAVITFNSDGSLNLNTGVVEMGTAGQTGLAQMLAQRMKMNIDRIHVRLDVDTQLNPEYWKTVASMTSYIAGRAVMRAADDLIEQLKTIASYALKCPPEDLEIANEQVFCRQSPSHSVYFKDIAFGFQEPNGNTIGTQIIGRGGFVLNHITYLDPKTGAGNVGPSWTVGAQGVEVELDRTECTYRLIKAYTVMDVGRVIDPKNTSELVRGGMSMGLSLASREQVVYNPNGHNLTGNFRAYKLLHIGAEPQYVVDFLETPQEDAPFGCRAYTEHGIIGMPAALGNALSLAAGVPLNLLPLTPENIWRQTKTSQGVKK